MTSSRLRDWWLDFGAYVWGVLALLLCAIVFGIGILLIALEVELL